MALNKLDNFIKNTEGRILYVSPSDLDSSDAIDNQGNSLARPFKTIQRALLEAARFSYVRGNDNDIVEKTTILLFPGEHIIDNRPGWAIYNNGGSAYAVPRTGGVGVPAVTELSLGLDSIFDLTQENNILYRFNSYYGGVVVPRGTSIIGLDLRKTKIRPKYVPNPTDPNVESSSIFRITGACYFWQFTLLDGDETGTVYTNPTFFSEEYTSTPLFSHHKLRCFEYADGVNKIESYDLTDLDMYYSKVSNAYNNYREILDKYPAEPNGFAKRTPEWEIVGAFQSDPIDISSIVSGNGTTPSNIITVTTEVEHNLNAGTPIKIRGVSEQTYNVSTKVQSIVNSTTFTYLLASFPANLLANPSSSGSTVTVETDTVSGASPYIFNCSLRSVWGMNGMYANGFKASGFKSMVVAQFTGVSLQKDDRAFVKYDPISRTYNGVNYDIAYGAALPTQASQTSPSQVYHLDSDAIYRPGWETSHIKISDDSFVQVVSVFAIGFNKHFDAESGGDYSITNSNSNFGQISLNSSGFRKFAFSKDNKAYVTSIISPRALTLVEEEVQWLSIDVNKTVQEANSSRLYLYGYTTEKTGLPASLSQGYRVGARKDDRLYVTIVGTDYSAKILMQNTSISAQKTYSISGEPEANIFTTSSPHTFQTGESVLLVSDIGDLPENIEAHRLYYIINLSTTKFKLASSESNANLGNEITVYRGSNLQVISRVSDKETGEKGSPLQWDSTRSNWYIQVEASNAIYNAVVANSIALGETTDLAFIKRFSDERSIDEKIYKLRVVIPKEAENSKNPEGGFIIQDSSSNQARNTADFTRTVITSSDHDFNRNPRFITTCSTSSNTVTVVAEIPHNLRVGDKIIVENVYDSQNTTGKLDQGYNGTFIVSSVPDDLSFTYSTTDIFGTGHITGVFQNNINSRTLSNIPYFSRNDLKSNLYIYRNEIISEYIEGIQDGIYHVYALNASNAISNTFTSLEYSQTPVDLYPQLDRDNLDYNPLSARTYAKSSPLGQVVTNDRKKSITRETIDKFNETFGHGIDISSVSGATGTSPTITFVKNHNLGGVVTGTIGGSGGSGYTNGTYYNVRLYSNSILTTWNGATANVVVSGGKVTSVTIVSQGSGYAAGTLYFDTTRIGNGSGATFSITTAGISTSIGDVVQFTGAGTTSDSYHRITGVPSKNTISIARTTGDPVITNGHYAFVCAPSIRINSTTALDVATGIVTFSCGTSTQNFPHGLVEGNQFRVINSSNNNQGDYFVEEVKNYYQFTAVINKSLSVSGGYVLKHGLSGNNAVSDQTGENIATRNTFVYGKEILILQTAVTTETTLSISCPIGIGTSKRFELGDYIQIDNEIMRISSTNNDSSINVLRGVFGTRQENHDQFSLIKKFHPIPVEFRRPSVVRASGHTFEYLGYGPGNYSTGLPQVQVKTLTDAEAILSQAQERSGGTVVYTGMNNSGDVFSGNTKTSATTGETVSFDIPTPTITGQQTSGLSVVYDEVTIKQRLLVEGGDSGTVLSQFDGPVTFNKDIRTKSSITLSAIDSTIRLNNTALNLISKGSASFDGYIEVDGASTFNSNVTLSSGNLSVTGIITATGNIFSGASLINGGFDFILGNKNQSTRGNSGSSRALVKDTGNTLSINYLEDFTGGTKVYGPLTVTEGQSVGGNLSVTGSATVDGSLDVTSNVTAGIVTSTYISAPNITPVGAVILWSGTNTNFDATYWRICNGQSLNTYTYRSLHALISNTYGGTAYLAGTTDLSGATTTFNIPDLRDKFIIGSTNNSGTTVDGTTQRTGGNKNSALIQHDHTGTTDDQNQSHTHSGTTGDDSPDHTHQFTRPRLNQNDVDGSPSNTSVADGSTTVSTEGASTRHQHAFGTGNASQGHTHTYTTSTEGTITGENANLPPYYALFYIMRIL